MTWVVYAERGEYSDYSWALVSFHATEAAAVAAVNELTQRVNDWVAAWEAAGEPDAFDAGDDAEALRVHAGRVLPFVAPGDAWGALENGYYRPTFEVGTVGSGTWVL
jgi:hypothetical protein